MARDAHRREDLLRDATALVPRVKLQLPDGVDVFAGFRGDALSVYFGDDPVYHFNAARELRRAHVTGRLIKAELGRLAALTRRETELETEMVRADLDDAAGTALLQDAERRLTMLRDALASHAVIIVGQAPAEGDAVERLAAWLDQPLAFDAAKSPRVS